MFVACMAAANRSSRREVCCCSPACQCLYQRSRHELIFSDHPLLRKQMKSILSLGIVTVLASLLSGCADTIAFGYGVHDKLECVVETDKTPPPSRQRGTFPFRLIYEADGQRQIVEDTQICEFKGRTCTFEGRKNVWQSTLASGQSQRVIQQKDRDQVHLEYVAPIGDCGDLMAKPDYHKTYTSSWRGGGLTLQIYEHGRLQDSIGDTAPKEVKVVSYEQWTDSPSAKP